MTDKTSDQIENDVRAALAADVYDQYDEVVTVIDYQTVATVMLEDGRVAARRLYSGNQNPRHMLGDATWLSMAAEEDIANQMAEEDRDV